MGRKMVSPPCRLERRTPCRIHLCFASSHPFFLSFHCRCRSRQHKSRLPTIERGVSVDPTEEQKSLSTSPAAVPHVVMALYAMLVLTIVCMPSRKA